MPLQEPDWWYRADCGWQARALAPVSRLWGWASARRIARATPVRAALPVICVGNFTAGGTGKTPLSIYIARLLIERGEHPVFLTRGYGGRRRGTHRVDPALDTAWDVGDEPLLLARHAPVVVSRDRVAGAAEAARPIHDWRPTVIVMDDGLQNPALAKNLSIAVVDARRGLGNGCVIPAGPLRAPIAMQLGLADAIVVNRPPAMHAGEPRQHDVASDLRLRFEGPVLEASVGPAPGTRSLTGQRVLALAGIANPGRFYALLEGLGAKIAGRAEFADHHEFTDGDAAYVLAEAARLGADVVTTEKDHVRLAGRSGALAQLQAMAMPVPIELRIEAGDGAHLAALIEAAVRIRP